MASALNTTGCPVPMKATSNGAFQHDNPLKFSFSLLVVQICVVILVTRTLALLLRPIRQPRVIAEIIGGIFLGPSLLGRSSAYLNAIFPQESHALLETVADIGLLYFLFLVGLEIDFDAIKRTGKKTLAIAVAGISLPFAGGVGVGYVLKETISKHVGFGQFIVFMGVSMSITAFPVLARILAELKLLTTDVGQMAMAAAAVNDVVAWILLALAIALTGTNTSPLVSVYILLCGIGFVVFMMLAVKPVMSWIGRRCPEGEPVNELYVCVTLAGVLAAGFITDVIGIHSIFGAFVFGITIPKEGPFGGLLIEKIEDFVSALLLPLYFAASGLKTNVASIHGGLAWALLLLVVTVACAGKILGTLFVAMINKVPIREGLTLGFLMNTKGLVELIVLNIGKDRKVLNDEVFAILVLMALVTTFVTTPVVTLIYQPARRQEPYKHRTIQRDRQNDQLRILACIHGTRNISSIINLIETSRGIRKPALRLYIMHMVELSERSSAIRMVHKARRNGRPFWNKNRFQQDQDRIVVAFQAFGQLSKVSVRPMTAISPLHSMHEDVCSVADRKRAAMIILPFHKQMRQDGLLETANMSLRGVNQRVLKYSPCSVGILVDRGLGGHAQMSPPNVDEHVAVLFFGGPDDREALEFGRRMAEHPGIKLSVVRFQPGKEFDRVSINLKPEPAPEHETNVEMYKFTTAETDKEAEKSMDEAAIESVKQCSETGESVEYSERLVSNTVDVVLDIARSDHYDLFLVGRGRRPSQLVADLADRTAQCPELGPIGDILASSDTQIKASVLIIQQHDEVAVHTDEVPHRKSVHTSGSVSESSSSRRGPSIRVDNDDNSSESD